MTTFTATDVNRSDSALLDAIYELGKANAQTADIACSVYPYPQRADIDSWKEKPIFIAIYDDTETLVAALAADNEGRIVGSVCKRFIGPNDPPGSSPDGNACATTMFAAIKERAGAVQVLSPNPNTKDAFIAQGAEVPNV